MRLLVSVRNPDEIEAALDGGADIIDAKDPGKGALGPVTGDVLAAIDRQVPLGIPMSAALGDAQSADAVRFDVAGLELRRRDTLYLKLGVSLGREGPDRLCVLLAAVNACASHPASPRFVGVAYADQLSGPTGLELLEGAREAGVAAMLLDTAAKDGRSLLDCWGEMLLRTWVQVGRAAGLEMALAGSIGLRQLGRVVALEPDIIGIRGAACAGGRLGAVEAGRVAALKSFLPPEPATNAAKHEPAPGSLSPPSILK